MPPERRMPSAPTKVTGPDTGLVAPDLQEMYHFRRTDLQWRHRVHALDLMIMTLYCTHCGTPHSEHAKYCSGCGKPIRSSAPLANEVPPKGYVGMNIEFTREQSDAVSASLDSFAAVANADAPKGTTMYMHPKAKDAMTAKARTEYVESLVLQLERCSEKQAANILDKAIKAQLKAYAIHNLPVYLFHAAGMFELVGDVGSANRFFRLFLQMQNEFCPDQIDTLFLNQTGFNMPKVIAKARAKLGQ